MQNLPIGHFDHLMSLRLPVQDNNQFVTLRPPLTVGHLFVTFISVYAPTLQAEIGVKEAFYCDLHILLQQAEDELLILGDFSTRVE